MAKQPGRSRSRPRALQLARYLVLVAVGAVMAFPFFWMLSTALKTSAEAATFPPTLLPAIPQWTNYPEALGAAPFGRYFLNSFVVAGSVCLSVVVCALFAGYAFAQLEFPGKRLVFTLYLATMMVPFEVVLIPNFLMISRLGLHNTYAAMILPWAANVFSVFLVTQFLRTLPRDYFEAAALDGCSHWSYLWRIAAPLCRPALSTGGLFAFLGSWNSLLWPLLVTKDDQFRTVEVGLQSFLQAEGPYPNLLMAASTVVMLPVLVLFFLVQRTFVEGVTSGVKG